MVSFNVNLDSNKSSKRNKQKRCNSMKNTVSRDIISPQLFSVHDRTPRTNENVAPISKNNYQIIDFNSRLKINYPKDFRPIFFATQQAKLPVAKLCSEIMTLMPYNKKQCRQSVSNKPLRNTSLARLTMDALAASETDINSILELVETIYNSIQEMLRDIKQKQQMYSPPKNIESERKQEPKYVIKIDVRKFVNYLNEQFIRHNSAIVLPNKTSQGSRELPLQVPYWKQPTVRYLTNKCRSFNILLQPRRMSFSITVCKFNSCSMDFFQRLATFYNTCNKMQTTTKRKPVPSVFIRDWHFKNVTQGYLLSVLLKHNNVMSLNVMRKLYFVIITSVTANLTIEINFKLANGIFMAYDTPAPPFEQLPFEVIHWNDKHRNILGTSSKIYNSAFTCGFPYNDDKFEDTKSDSTLLISRSSSNTSSTLKYESSSCFDDSDYFERSSSCSETSLLDLKTTASSTNITRRESIKTLTLSIDDILSCHVLLNRKDCGDMNFAISLEEQNNLFNSRQQNRPWMTKVYRESSKLKAEILMPYLNSVMNETIFDRVSISMGGCIRAFTQYFSQIESRQFCKRFVEDFVHYLAHTILSSLVYY